MASTTRSQPITTLRKRSYPFSALETRQYPASEVEPVLMPWALR